MSVARGLGLHAHDLRAIATALESLEKSGVITDNIRVGGHRIVLQRNLGSPMDQRDDTPTYVVTAIEPYGLDPIRNDLGDQRDARLR
jgi:hypothetical protein